MCLYLIEFYPRITGWAIIRPSKDESKFEKEMLFCDGFAGQRLLA